MKTVIFWGGKRSNFKEETRKNFKMSISMNIHIKYLCYNNTRISNFKKLCNSGNFYKWIF